MNIEHTESGTLSITVNFTIEQSDYADKVKTSLNDIRRKAEIKGFRKGMVPMGLIQKMHGRDVLLEEVQKLLADGLEKYINDNNIKTIGEPLPNEELKSPIDWDHDETFHFSFDLMLAPKVELILTADDHIPIKQPKIGKKDKDGYIESLCKQYGRLTDVDAAESEDFLKVDLNQGDTLVSAAYLTLKTIKDEALRQPFIGLKVGDTAEIDLIKTFPLDTDRAALLKVKKEELDNANPLWQLTVLEVKRFAPAPLDQQFYDRVFGKDEVDSPEAFIKKVEERMQREFAAESDYRFTRDARDYVINKCAIELPDPLIKRWLHVSNDRKVSMEEIERDYDAFAHDFRWQIIRGYLIKEHHIEITQEEITLQAIRVAHYRFASYGYESVPQEQLEKYATSLLSDQREESRITEMVQDDKVLAFIRSSVTLDPEKVPFSKMHEINTPAK